MQQENLIMFEEQCMRMLLEGENPVLSFLRTQYKLVRDKKITTTGVGFYVDYYLENSVERVDEALQVRGNFEIGDLEGSISSLKNGLGFALFIRRGILSFLEAYTYDEEFPENLYGVVLSYGQKRKRDLLKLSQHWEIEGDEETLDRFR